MLHCGQVGPIRAAHVHPVGEVEVELSGVPDEAVAPLAQILRHLRAVDRVPLGRHPVHGLVDRRVRHPRHQLAGDLLDHRPLHVGQQPARDVVVVRGQALDPLRVLARVAHEARHHAAGRGHRLALVAREGLVGVLGQRLPQRSARDARPAPLALVPVPVPDHEVEQPCLEEGPAVDTVLRAALAPLLPEPERGHDLGDAFVARLEVIVERANRAAERRAEFPERRVVRHHREARAVEADPHRPRERAGDDGRRGVGRRGLVDRDRSELAVLPFLRQHALGVLLQLAEGVAVAVRTLQGQAFRLESSDLAQRREARGLGGEVEHRELDRRRPGLAVAVPEPVAPLAAAVELLAGDDRPGFRRDRARRCLRCGLVRRRDGGGQGRAHDRANAARFKGRLSFRSEASPLLALSATVLPRRDAPGAGGRAATSWRCPGGSP